MQITLIWNPQQMVYVESDETERCPRWTPSTGEMEPGCHWWTTDEAEDYVGEPGFVVVGGPLDDDDPGDVALGHFLTSNLSWTEYEAQQAWSAQEDRDVH